MDSGDFPDLSRSYKVSINRISHGGDAQSGIYGPIEVLTADGDTVLRLLLDSPGDCWGHSAVRADTDTAYIGWVNVNKLTGLATIKTASAPIDLSAALTPKN